MKDIHTQPEKYFPIQSQSGLSDRIFLLNSIEFITRFKDQYSYVEIGSFLGGSLTPFLMDQRCTSVLSIDERERILPDERGANFDYAGVTNQKMIDNLHSHGITTEKLITFDGSIDNMDAPAETFDLAFIDGEHTDVACFRDFLWVLPMMKQNAIIMFHDSTLVFKALRLIQLYMKKRGLPFKFSKKTDSDMSAIFLGDFSTVNTISIFGAEDNLDDFYAVAEMAIINHLIANRVVVQFHATVTPPKTRPAF
jgi:hypothetical protein